MGTIPYNFLSESILFDEKEINSQFSSLSDEVIEKLLQDYREYCLKNITDITKEITQNKSSLKVLSSLEKIPFDVLKQGSLYLEQFILYDPLFKYTQTENETSKILTRYLGFDKNTINRSKLSVTLKFLKSITPMIVGDFIKILPISYNFEPSKETPINFPINYYADVLPDDIMKYFRDNAIVQSMIKEKGGWRILDNQDLTPGLIITFKDHDENHGSIFHYFEGEVDKIDSNSFSTKMELAKYPMDKNIWSAWVFQSINSSSKAIFDKIFIENLIANDLKATYLTDNTFTANLLTNNLEVKGNVETTLASQFMNLELPFLDNIDINKLMEIRTNEVDLLNNFRTELDKQIIELRAIKDLKEIQQRKEYIIREISNVQIKKIDEKLNRIKKNIFMDAILTIGGLAGTVQTSGWSLLSVALATISGFKTYKEYKEKITENPYYLLWKVLKK